MDEVGTVLPDLEAARAAAVNLMRAVLNEDPERHWAGEEWRVVVHDGAGRELVTLSFAASFASDPEASRSPAAGDLRTQAHPARSEA